MKDQSLRVIKSIATPLSIVIKDDEVEFRVPGDFEKGGRIYKNPIVSIELNEIDAIVGDETKEDDEMLKEVKTSLYIVSE